MIQRLLKLKPLTQSNASTMEQPTKSNVINFCQHCGEVVSAEAKYCQQCGRALQISRDKITSKTIWFWVNYFPQPIRFLLEIIIAVSLSLTALIIKIAWFPLLILFLIWYNF